MKSRAWHLDGGKRSIGRDSQYAFRLLVSSQPHINRANQLGSAQYSYRYVEDKFRSLFEEMGVPTTFVEAPESIKSSAALAALGIQEDESLIHVSFREPASFRPIPSVPNVLATAWEFTVIKTQVSPGESITKNTLHMLHIADQIWTPCTFTNNTFAKYGIATSVVIPHPIKFGGSPMPAAAAFEILRDVPVAPFCFRSGAKRESNAAALIERIASLRAHFAAHNFEPGSASPLFVAALNPGDLRKNLANLVEGFQIAARAHPGALLLLKFSVPNMEDFRHTALHDHVLPRFSPFYVIDEPRILCIFDYLSNEEMTAFYSLGDFYVSASHCEAFNLPVVEAIAAGTAVISTHNTAMLDYLVDGGFIPISERSFTRPVQGMAGDDANEPYDLSFADRFDVARAILRSLDLSRNERSAMGERALFAAQAFCASDHVGSLVRERLGNLRAGST